MLESLKILENLVGKKEEKKAKEISNLHNIKAFAQNINKCKIFIENVKSEQIPSFLENNYSLKLNGDLNLMSIELHRFTNSLLSPLSHKESEHSLRGFQNSVANLDEILNILMLDFRQLQRKKKKLLSSNAKKINEAKNKIKKILSIKENLEAKIEYEARVLSEAIIQNISDIVIVYSSLSILANKNKNNFFILEIANCIDRIKKVIEPSYSNRSLKSQDMIYYYAIYELRELKGRICPIINAT